MEKMKISSWNINGYRAIVKKGFRDWFENDEADVVCLQEIKAHPEQIEESDRTYSGYKAYWNPAAKLGYSGVAAFVREPPVNLGFGVGDDEFDSEGRVIWMDYDNFRLFNVYFPSGQRGMGRVEFKLRFYMRLLEICDELMAGGKSIIICGDFNTAHNEIDLANPKNNKNTSGFLQAERDMVSKYMRYNFVDIYREMYPDKIEYTWWTYITQARQRNIGWRLDYFLISSELVNDVREACIQGNIYGSDHCPISLILK